MKKIYCLILILLCTQTSFAFDSERQGFVLGGGIGFAPTAYTEFSEFGSSQFKTSGPAVSFIAGYGYNENTLFLLMIEGLQSHTESLFSNDEFVRQGFTGVGVRFYFDDIGESIFISSGIGLQHYIISPSSNQSHDAGLGFLIGGGYEFSEHFQLSLNITNGQTKSSFNWDHMQLIMAISFVLY